MTIQTYRYEALEPDGAVQKGTIEAESADAAAVSLNGRRLVPLSVTQTGQGLQREIRLPGVSRRASARDLAVMTRQFASMTASGLTLMRTLSILEQQAPKPALREALGAVHEAVREGSNLSTALAEHPQQFSTLMVSMVAAGETGGFLDEALDRIATMFESDAALRAKIKAAATYPLVVLVFSLLMMIGVVWFIVPIFEKMFAQLGGQLPLPTRVLVVLSHNLWWVLPLAVAGVVASTWAYRRSYRTNATFRLRADRLRLRVPVFGPLFNKLAISRWARNLSTLLSVGVPVTQALEMVGATAGNAVIANAMIEVRDSVRTGSTIARPLARHPVFPSMLVQMVEVGEESGRTSEMLSKAADYYDDEVENATEGLTSALEPLLVVFIGAVIGAMVICLYLPMFSIYQNIQTN
ncbi:MAG: type II secretion system F family protein [Nocardioides sp.]|nr:type II secretion system F family protein [Nocardioides sp.]